MFDGVCDGKYVRQTCRRTRAHAAVSLVPETCGTRAARRRRAPRPLRSRWRDERFRLFPRTPLSRLPDVAKRSGPV